VGKRGGKSPKNTYNGTDMEQCWEEKGRGLVGSDASRDTVNFWDTTKVALATTQKKGEKGKKRENGVAKQKKAKWVTKAGVLPKVEGT